MGKGGGLVRMGSGVTPHCRATCWKHVPMVGRIILVKATVSVVMTGTQRGNGFV